MGSRSKGDPRGRPQPICRPRQSPSSPIAIAGPVSVYVRVCVYVCVCERERVPHGSHQKVIIFVLVLSPCKSYAVLSIAPPPRTYHHTHPRTTPTPRHT